MPATVSHTARIFPFGEEMAAQHAGGAYATRYKFNGKELDPETGYYYYGARYYDPVISRWLSIDPLAEKYPGLSPYNYTANNPVMLVDPDGKGSEWVPVKGKPGKWKAEKGDSAWTLAQDANISYEKANKLIQEQLGPNKIIDGKEYSNVKPGDIVSIPTNNSDNKPTMLFDLDKDGRLDAAAFSGNNGSYIVRFQLFPKKTLADKLHNVASHPIAQEIEKHFITEAMVRFLRLGARFSTLTVEFFFSTQSLNNGEDYRLFYLKLGVSPYDPPRFRDSVLIMNTLYNFNPAGPRAKILDTIFLQPIKP